MTSSACWSGSKSQTKPSPKTKVCFHRNHSYSKLTVCQNIPQTNDQPIWMEDIVYAAVHNTDELVFSLFNEHYSLVAFQKMTLHKLYPFINTGELVTQKLNLQSEKGLTIELSVSFSLFQPKEPIAGLFLFDLSLDISNQSWKTEQQQQSNDPKEQKSKLLLCLNCDQIEGFTELPLLRPNINKR